MLSSRTNPSRQGPKRSTCLDSMLAVRPSLYRWDNGSEFALEFSLAVQQAGIRHRYIKPRRPDQNGKVERSHRIDNEEFWSRWTFETLTAASAALQAWERTYNVDRFSLSLQGRTPAEKLAHLLPALATA